MSFSFLAQPFKLSFEVVDRFRCLGCAEDGENLAGSLGHNTPAPVALDSDRLNQVLERLDHG